MGHGKINDYFTSSALWDQDLEIFELNEYSPYGGAHLIKICADQMKMYILTHLSLDF